MPEAPSCTAEWKDVEEVSVSITRNSHDGAVKIGRQKDHPEKDFMSITLGDQTLTTSSFSGAHIESGNHGADTDITLDKFQTCPEANGNLLVKRHYLMNTTLIGVTGDTLDDLMELTKEGLIRHWVTPHEKNSITGLSYYGSLNGYGSIKGGAYNASSITDSSNKQMPTLNYSGFRLLLTRQSGNISAYGYENTTCWGIVQNASSPFAFEQEPLLDNESRLTVDANGGVFSDGSSSKSLFVNTGDLTSISSLVSRDKMQLTSWNTKADGTGDKVSEINANRSPRYGATIYAQWEKSTGKPTKVDIDCSASAMCSIVTWYQDANSVHRNIQGKNGTLDWNGSPIPGVRLDGDGYHADSSCAPGVCYYVSLAENPPSQGGNTYNMMPTTGAPEGLSTIGLIAVGVGLAGLGFAVVRRGRSTI